ncbi:class I SAM-dependent methyltransferase [Tropicibacter sp. R16_0]|uniref:methyltransferase domain-containing protein n=1 Tax=Tropicibacter sp. R16_0 TaxID=2821102 RepID=UPI001ADC6373|nr:class I SAM-dependent methyltransferase [Tropicibacter sp. R16_0]MBO9449386.1 class I SAM-dependent methyltransferase [Tropicibacter sp. R16_0]
MSLFRQLFYKQRKFYDDDFDWDNYTADSYHRRLKEDVETEFRAISNKGQLSFDAETGHVTSHGEGIHPNHQLIFEAIGQLRPETVHEVGCGGGDHVANASTLFPDVHVTGGDRGQTQLELALQRHPQLKGRIGIQDITMPFSTAWPKADMVYSQAVIMHIHTAVSHFVGLANMVRQANDFVLLVENNQCHNFVRDIEALFAGGHLAWDTLQIYRMDGSGGARGILLAREAQDLPRLTSDVEICEGVKPSMRRLKRAAEDSARGLFGFDLA